MRRFAILLLAVAAGCGGDTVVSPETVTFAGIYSLKSINGQSLPFVYIQSGQNSSTVVDDHLTISDGGTWSETLNIRTIQNGVTSNQTSAAAGTWIRSGNALGFINGNGNTQYYAGTFSSNRLDLTDAGLAFVFMK